jgi:hypothetical protein
MGRVALSVGFHSLLLLLTDGTNSSNKMAPLWISCGDDMRTSHRHRRPSSSQAPSKSMNTLLTVFAFLRIPQTFRICRHKRQTHAHLDCQEDASALTLKLRFEFDPKEVAEQFSCINRYIQTVRLTIRNDRRLINPIHC